MAISTPLARLLPLLLLLLPPALREPFSPNHRPKDAVIGEELHPVVLVPGLGCSDLEARLTEAYRDGDTLFGAPYDWRHAPPVPGQRSQVYSLYFQQLKALVEAASKKHHGRMAIILAHSYGGMVALEFVRNAPLSWRRRYIKHLILVAPTLSEGFLQQATALATGPGQMIYVPAADVPLRTLWRSLETAIADLPSPEVFGHDEPIVVTKQRNYSAHDMEDFLAAIGFRDGVEPFSRRMVPKMQYFQAPMVPMTCIKGVGNRTPRQLVFWEGDYDASPELVYGDGDGFVNLVSILAFDREMRGQPGQNKQFKSVKIDKAQHSGLVTDEWAVNKV